MEDKQKRKMLGPTLQEFELVPITDPIEFSEMERRCSKVGKKKKEASEGSVDRESKSVRKRRG